ncbi:MAG: glycoside hydrolase family 3 protein, partial [Sediminibacterium sp.]|nr:glycoside hydrolase family 3 protein [Sediminibacterium sp.]
MVAIIFASPVLAQQPALGYRSVKLITQNGKQFKDLNRNGKLDPYEDWRLAATKRAENLVQQMSLEEKVGFMLISSARLKNDWSFEAPKNREPISSDFNEEDLIQSINMFTKKPLPPNMMAAGTTKGVRQFHLRHFIMRANVSARITAEWTNKIQELCEREPLGIPAIFASNPRNHITKDASIGLSVGKTTFST